MLGFSSAWAFDWHGPHADERAHVITQDDAGPHFDGDACDDCCHSLVHLLGLTNDKPTIMFGPGNIDHLILVSAYNTRATDPPLKPPQS